MVQAADEQTALEDEIENLKQQLEDSEKQQATLVEKVWHACKGVAKLALSFSPISSTNFSWNVLILMEDLSRHTPDPASVSGFQLSVLKFAPQKEFERCVQLIVQEDQ